MNRVVDVENNFVNYDMQNIIRSNINLHEELLRSQSKKIPFEEEIIVGRAIRNNQTYQLTVEDISELDSGFQSRFPTLRNFYYKPSLKI